MKPIFLTGYMASGKTTFGRALARELGVDFIDLDFYIEQRFRKSVKDIFATEGEERFRKIERNMLREAGEFENVVISCGGGTPCYFDNMQYMNGRGTTVWLRATVERTVERLLSAPAKRPLVEGKSREELAEYVSHHMAERLPWYSQSHIEFPSDRLEDKRMIGQSVKEFIQGCRGCLNI